MLARAKLGSTRIPRKRAGRSFRAAVSRRAFLILWLCFLPVAQVTTLGWYTIPICIAIGYELLGYEVRLHPATCTHLRWYARAKGVNTTSLASVVLLSVLMQNINRV